jgi:hypothetical protein
LIRVKQLQAWVIRKARKEKEKKTNSKNYEKEIEKEKDEDIKQELNKGNIVTIIEDSMEY